MKTEDNGVQRNFETGATRDTGSNKLDYSGFLCPSVLRQFAKYMNMNRLQSDGTLRASDNWQKGIPMDVYVESGWRHFWEWWYCHRLPEEEVGRTEDIEIVAGICGLMFNCMGYLHEWLKRNDMVDFDDTEPTLEMLQRKLDLDQVAPVQFMPEKGE